MFPPDFFPNKPVHDLEAMREMFGGRRRETGCEFVHADNIALGSNPDKNRKWDSSWSWLSKFVAFVGGAWEGEKGHAIL